MGDRRLRQLQQRTIRQLLPPPRPRRRKLWIALFLLGLALYCYGLWLAAELMSGNFI